MLHAEIFLIPSIYEDKVVRNETPIAFIPEKIASQGYWLKYQTESASSCMLLELLVIIFFML